MSSAIGLNNSGNNSSNISPLIISTPSLPPNVIIKNKISELFQLFQFNLS